MTFPTIHHPQRCYWAGGSLLLVGAAIAGLVILNAPSREAPPAPAPETTRNGAASPASRSDARRTFGKPFAHLARLDSPAASELDPEDRPEFFAELVEDAQPVLIDLLEKQLADDLRHDIDREVTALRRTFAVDDRQAAAIREELETRFATALAADIEAVRAGSLTLEAAHHNARTRRKSWPAVVHEVVDAHRSPDRQAGGHRR